QGIANVVVAAASIEVHRRKRRAKSDHRDAAQLVSMLVRSHAGEIKALLANQGIALATVTARFPEERAGRRRWDGAARGADLRPRLLREFARWQRADQPVQELENERRPRVRRADTPHVGQVRRLLDLAGIGLSGSWLLVVELFGWRKFRKRRQVGAIVGLTPTPYQSGASSREQGISKAGTKQVRRLLVELAWAWRRWQPTSALRQWYQRRFADQGRRARQVGIVALARRLLIARWRYLEHGEVPEGARLVSGRAKVNAKAMAGGKETAA